MDSITDRIALIYENEKLDRHINENEKLDQRKFAKIVGLNEGSFRNLLSKGGYPSMDTILRIIAKFPKYSVEWLLTGEGSMIKCDPLNVGDDLFSRIKKQGLVPFFSDAQMRKRNYDLDVLFREEEPDGFIKIPGINVDVFFTVSGFGMEPKIFSGDTIGAVRFENIEKPDPDKIYLIVTNDDRMIKNLERDENESDFLWAVSPNHPRFKIYVGEIRRIFQIVFIGRSV